MSIRNWKDKIKKLSSSLKITPNIIIIPASLLVSLVLFCIAKRVDGIWYDFTVNMSASMLIIGITVLLVDLLRESHKSRLYKNPKQTALTKIAGTNSVLALSLAVFNRNKHLAVIKELVQDASSADDNNNFVTDSTSKAMKELSKIPANEIVAAYSDDKLSGDLKNSLTRINDTYNEVMARYSFSFTDITLRSDFADLVEHLDAVIQSINIVDIGMTDQEMQKLFKPVDPKKPGDPMTKNWFVGLMLQKYLISYSKFVYTHLGK